MKFLLYYHQSYVLNANAQKPAILKLSLVSSRRITLSDQLEFGVIGLGRMGGGLALQAMKKGMKVVGWTCLWSLTGVTG